MKATTLTPNLVQLTRYGMVNAFLVREDDGLTLVDTTTGGAADAILAAAREAGGELRRIALTHLHGDHVGSVAALRERLGDDVPILMPALEPIESVATRADVLLSHGDRVGSLEVVASPGHSVGHVAFHDTRDGSLVAGDVFTTIGGIAVTCHRWLRFPLPAMATVDPALDLESARVLRALDPPLLAVGHGKAIPEPAAAMDKAIARAEQRLAGR